MSSLTKRPTAGFTLIEALAATAFASVFLVVLLGYVTHIHQVRVRVEAIRQSALAAHHQCEMFSVGLIRPDIMAGSDAKEIVETILTPEDLPGGFPVTKRIETVTFTVDGLGVKRTAALKVEIFAETSVAPDAAAKPTATATGLRIR